MKKWDSHASSAFHRTLGGSDKPGKPEHSEAIGQTLIRRNLRPWQASPDDVSQNRNEVLLDHMYLVENMTQPFAPIDPFGAGGLRKLCH
jgi:hypothetical protein